MHRNPLWSPRPRLLVVPLSLPGRQLPPPVPRDRGAAVPASHIASKLNEPMHVGGSS